jgi:cytidine deaminase
VLGRPSERDDELVVAATGVRERAYAPYSGYRVGAALLDDAGAVHVGCNVENAAYPAGVCAERVALVSAVAAGRRGFRAQAVVTDGDEPAAPCGLCRQALAEFAPALRIVLATIGGRRLAVGLDELLPLAFGPATLTAGRGGGGRGGRGGGSSSENAGG